MSGYVYDVTMVQFAIGYGLVRQYDDAGDAGGRVRVCQVRVCNDGGAGATYAMGW